MKPKIAIYEGGKILPSTEAGVWQINFGIVPQGTKSRKEIDIANEGDADAFEIVFDFGNMPDDLKIINAPEEIAAGEKEKLIMESFPVSEKSKGLKIGLKISGKYLT